MSISSKRWRQSNCFQFDYHVVRQLGSIGPFFFKYIFNCLYPSQATFANMSQDVTHLTAYM